MKRLLGSSRFWVFMVGAVVATTLAALGKIDGKHALEVVAVVAVALIGGTSLEDAAQKWKTTERD